MHVTYVHPLIKNQSDISMYFKKSLTKTLRAAFGAVAAGALISSSTGTAFADTHLVDPFDCGPVGNVSSSSPAETDGAEPSVIHAFDGAAQSAPRLKGMGLLDDALQRQKQLMQNTDNAQRYNDYLAQFDQYKDQPLCEMAKSVNSKVLNDITYDSTMYGSQSGSYWAAPVETVVYRAGDCKDYTSLQYAILRYLGVPEDRLFVAIVNSHGLKTSTDHAVLLLNLAPTDEPANFVVLNDSGFIVSDREYEKGGLEYNGLHEMWANSYTFYLAQNQSGVWSTQLFNDTYLKPNHINSLPSKTPRLVAVVG